MDKPSTKPASKPETKPSRMMNEGGHVGAAMTASTDFSSAPKGTVIGGPGEILDSVGASIGRLANNVGSAIGNKVQTLKDEIADPFNPTAHQDADNLRQIQSQP